MKLMFYQLNYPGLVYCNIHSITICKMHLYSLSIRNEYNNLSINNLQGGYPELNRELTVPHTVVLPIELYPP